MIPAFHNTKLVTKGKGVLAMSKIEHVHKAAVIRHVDSSYPTESNRYLAEEETTLLLHRRRIKAMLKDGDFPEFPIITKGVVFGNRVTSKDVFIQAAEEIQKEIDNRLDSLYKLR